VTSHHLTIIIDNCTAIERIKGEVDYELGTAWSTCHSMRTRDNAVFSERKKKGLASDA
jgi:hypothetical protein